MTILQFDQEIKRLDHNARFLQSEPALLKRRRRAFEKRTLLETNTDNEYQDTLVACVDFSLFLLDKYDLNVSYGIWTISPITSKPRTFMLNADQTFWDKSLLPEDGKGNIIKFVGLLNNTNLDESYDLIEDYLKWGPVLW